MCNFWRRSYPDIDYSDLLRTIEIGSLDECHILLAFHHQINYLNGVDSMLLKYRKPEGDKRNLTIHSIQKNGEFELAVLNVPWNSSGFPFLPLILQRGTGIIFGIMLPFNEIYEILTRKQHRQIGNLSMIWTKFAVEQQMGIQLG